ncbi:MAG: LamG domain-containing protein [Acidobacteriota bacterium]
MFQGRTLMLGLVFGMVSFNAWAQCGCVTDGLVSCWSAEGDAADVTSTNPGILLNGVGFGPGIVGQAFSFDGVDDHVLVPDDPSLDFGTDDFTVATWVKTSFLGGTTNDLILSKTSSGVDVQYGLSYRAGLTGPLGAPRFAVGDGADVVITETTSNIADGEWHYLVGVREGVTTRLYLDCELVATATTPMPLNVDSLNDLAIGGRQNPINDPYFRGLIDEVAIFDRALTESEIRACHESVTTDPCLADCGTPCFNEDFEGFAAGDEITTEIAGVTISGTSPVLIFDGSAPSCDDEDLSTPGPGDGNLLGRGGVLILQETWSACAPDDSRDGGVMTFTFDAPVRVDGIGLLDIDEPGSTLTVTSDSGVESISLQPQSDNSWQEVAIARCGVTEIVVELAGSGAVTDLTCTEPLGRRARSVWSERGARDRGSRARGLGWAGERSRRLGGGGERDRDAGLSWPSR